MVEQHEEKFIYLLKQSVMRDDWKQVEDMVGERRSVYLSLFFLSLPIRFK